MKRRATTGDKASQARSRKVQNPKPRAAPAVPRSRRSLDSDLQSELEQRTRELAEARSQLAESLQQQTATADVLKSISRSTFDLQVVLDTLAQSAVTLCEADQSVIRRRVGESYPVAATSGFSQRQREHLQHYSQKADRGSIFGRAIVEGRTIHISDVVADPEFARPDQPRATGIRAAVGVPLLREGAIVGTLVVSRQEPRAFSDKQIGLLETFADQAVIAIENARLLNELRQRTDDLSESLDQQTATSDVLKVISSSPSDLEPVFRTLLENATRICEAKFGNLTLWEGDAFRAVAVHGEVEFVARRREQPRVTVLDNPGVPLARLAANKTVIHVADMRLEQVYIKRNPRTVELVETGGARTLLAVPMLKDDALIGAIVMYRQEVRPFTDKQIELVQNFAAQAVIAIENARLLNELRESLQQQTATAEILQAINSSPGDLLPVFDAILNKAHELCSVATGALVLRESEIFRAVATHSYSGSFAERLRQGHRGADNPLIRALIDGERFVHIPDLRQIDDPTVRASVENAGIRTGLYLPLRKDGVLLGMISCCRREIQPFSDKEIALLENFAVQAVIAIENARLLNELRQRTDDLTESLEQQTATSEVLQVISSSPGELGPVFNAILENATRICDASFGNLLLYDGGAFRRVALHNAPESWAEDYQRHPIVPRGRIPYRLVEAKQPIQIADLAIESPDDPITRLAGARTLLVVPMLKENELVGGIGIYRQEARPFTEKQIALVSNFGAQAVIAIENTRLLNELRQRTDDLSEALEQQTATSEVLKIISASPGDLEPVFNAMLENAVRICEAEFGALHRYQSGSFYPMALHNIPPALGDYLQEQIAVTPRAGTSLDRLVRTKSVVSYADESTEQVPGNAARLGGARSLIGVPMLKNNELIGAFVIYRQEVRPFTDKQIELVQNFAAQAVIAIENTRLLNELRESLAQQTATADVLKTISRSTFDLQTVLDTLVESAARLCRADRTAIRLAKDGLYHHVASYGHSLEHKQRMEREPLRPDEGSMPGRIAREGKPVHLVDAQSDPDPSMANRSRLGNVRSMLGLPLLREGIQIGVLLLQRSIVQPFTDKQIELAMTFADQAVIAIENVRLFDEVQARTRELTESLQQQTATADVLKVISRSTFDLQTVLETLVESAARLCDADKTIITRQRDGVFYRAEAYGFSREFLDYVRNIPIEPERGSAFGRALLEGHAVHIPDVKMDPDYTLVEGQRLGDYRTVLAVPMVREGIPTGVLSLTRSDVRPFTEKQIELASTFADQAAIAIENVRLFESVEARTRELAASLEDLRTAQDRLVQTQKLASLGQLTAGIAHEIKNPLNFVNNFSSLSTEMLDELQEALQRGQFDHKTRAEIDELTETLRANLDKIEQHGKRADSIVKNMLLHSREGSGEHRPVDVNSLVEESLNLAYHGARAEKQGFNITLERSLDPAAGKVDVFPQEITRVLLNLISNGFYAATKRRAEVGDGYEPTLAAVTKDLGDRVEIRIRDNGTGVPPEVKDKMFNPFFTTKPAGEGTGLGLSLSHDIIVKQHAGSIEVDTEPGQFTEFRIILPRTAATLAKSGGRA